MIKIYLHEPTHFGNTLLSLYSDFFTRVDSAIKADLIIVDWLLDVDRNIVTNKYNDDQKHKLVYVNTTNVRNSYWEKNGKESLDIRHGIMVDSKVLKPFKPIKQGLSFSIMHIDLLESKTIGVPISYTRPSNI